VLYTVEAVKTSNVLHLDDVIPPNVEVEWVASLRRISKVSGSNLSPNTWCPYRLFCNFSQFLEVDVGIVHTSSYCSYNNYLPIIPSFIPTEYDEMEANE
jgi:hypothetical protein